jgi:hypothetical protein
MAIELADAGDLSAIQIDDQVIVTARRQNAEPGDVLVLDERPVRAEYPEFSLLRENLFSQRPHEFADSASHYAFRAIKSNAPISWVTVFEKNGSRRLPVEQRHGGVEQSGMQFDLPILDSRTPLSMVIGTMRKTDRRAVILREPHNEFRLLTNYEIARAYVNDLGLKDVASRAHPISLWRNAIPQRRTRLFSMVDPQNAPFGHVTSLFESIGGTVANSAKICLCSSKIPAHTVVDQMPSLDGNPCPRIHTAMAIYECF